MYLPPEFTEHDMDEIQSLAAHFPLAVCVAHDGVDFEINHLPMIWDGDVLIGHIAHANKMHENLENGGAAAFIFRAENTYISPNWYPTKAETHRHVPTWNYQVVHMHGRLFFHHGKKEKLSVVGRLTKLHEQRENGDQAWKMRDAPKDYMDGMLDKIVAIEFKIDRIEAKSKLSQNREARDFDGVMQKMDEKGFQGMFKRMKKLKET